MLYRLFRLDPMAVYGLTDLGTGLGRWDQATLRIVVPGPSGLRFGTDLGLGDASLRTADHAYVWGCPRPAYLTRDCILARFDAQGAMELFAGPGGFLASQNAKDASSVFDSGPWVSSVLANPSTAGLLHVYAPDFGTDLQTHVASAPEGPWTAAAPLGACDLPGDTHAYCAGPVVHEDLGDPSRPGEVVVSYGIGTTAAGGTSLMGADPRAYWSRLAWKTAP